MTEDESAEAQAEVMDASAILAWLQLEPGSDQVKLANAVINAVNWSEVLQKAAAKGIETKDLVRDLTMLGLQVTSFSAVEAVEAARLFPAGKSVGLSLADRACLATAIVLNRRAVTADRSWSAVHDVAEVRFIR